MNARLEHARAALHPIARGLFDRLGVERAPAPPRTDVEQLLGLRNVHASLYAFEDSFGGLVIPSAGGPIGAYHMLRAWELSDRDRRRPDLDLVPVCITNLDFMHYLDREGRGWTHDTIEGPAPMLVSRDGAGLVTFLLAMELLERMTVQHAPAAAIASAKGLELIGAGGVEIYASDAWLLVDWPTGLVQMCSL